MAVTTTTKKDINFQLNNRGMKKTCFHFKVCYFLRSCPARFQFSIQFLFSFPVNLSTFELIFLRSICVVFFAFIFSRSFHVPFLETNFIKCSIFLLLLLNAFYFYLNRIIVRLSENKLRQSFWNFWNAHKLMPKFKSIKFYIFSLFVYFFFCWFQFSKICLY